MSPRAIRLTRKNLNAYLWAKQGLDTKHSRKNPGVVEVVERNLGIYGTAPTCYLSLLARKPDLRLEDLDRETVDRRRLVRLRAMRASQFLVSAADLPMVYQATKDLPQANFGKILRKMGVADDLYSRTAEQVEDLVAGEPRTASELRADARADSDPLREAFPFIVAQMCHEGRLVRVRARGGWKSDRFEYARLADRFPGVDLRAMHRDAARRELARRYFAAYGPATAEDFRWWSGLSKKQADAVLAGLGEELAEVDVLGLRGTCLALESERRSLESRSRPAPRGVALLPVWDAYLMAYADRGRYLDREWADRIFDPSGNGTSTIFLNGRAVGVWDFEELEKRLRVKLAPLSDFPRAAWQQARKIGTQMTRMIGKKDLILERCTQPRPLSEGRRNQFLSPLKGMSGSPV